MQFDFLCAQCLAARQAEALREEPDGERQLACYRDCLRAIADAPKGVSAPYLIPVFAALRRRYFGGPDDRDEACKRESSRVMRERLPALREQVRASAEPLYAALQLAAIGNYIDFAVLRGRVDFAALDEMLAGFRETALDRGVYRAFRADAEKGGSLLYLTDNCGEILLDTLVLEQLRREFPQLSLTVCVRGGPAQNDALRADAEEAGIPALARLIDNGSRIPATEPDYLGAEAAAALASADLILAKGQANLESLLGCGKNIYYLFLCKCSRFTERFGVPPMTGLFLREETAARRFFQK